MTAKHIFVLTTAALVLASPLSLQAQQPPETIEEAKGLGLQFLKEIPQAIQGVWESQAVPVFLGMWNWAKDIWNRHVFSWLRGLWEQLLGIFGREIEQRSPFIQQQFEQEKQQLKQEIEESIPQEGRTLWEHIKRFFGKDEGE